MKSVRLMALAMTAGAVALLATTAAPASASTTPSPAAYKALGPKVEAARLKTAFPADSFTCHDQEYLNSSANADYVSARTRLHRRRLRHAPRPLRDDRAVGKIRLRAHRQLEHHRPISEMDRDLRARHPGQPVHPVRGDPGSDQPQLRLGRARLYRRQLRHAPRPRRDGRAVGEVLQHRPVPVTAP